MTVAVSIASHARIRATPYARRLARERGLSLLKIVGSGPNGRITGVDLNSAPPASDLAERSPLAAVRNVPASGTDATGSPSAIAATIDFQAVEALLGQIRALRSDVTRQDICLKAAVLALALAAPGVGSDILLLTSPSRRQALVGVAQASLGLIATLRSSSDDGAAGGLAVSFLGHAGVRPVAAQLGGSVRMRLVVGFGDVADCLFSYDPSQITDEAAESFLVTFREFVETPIRLLV